LYVKTPCAVSVIYFGTQLSIALLNISICETHSAPSRGLGVYIVDTTYVVS
jgi:hypothetical protein